jgi:EpsI family protein
MASLPPTYFFITRLVVVMVLGAVTALAFHMTSAVNAAAEIGVIMDLPMRVGEFTGADQPLSEGEKVALPKDTEIVKKQYTDSSGEVLNANIVLAGAEKRSIHRPEVCLPAQGWSINQERVIPLHLADGRTISVMQVSISRPVEISPGITRSLSSYYDYWFVGNGITTPSHVMRILLNSWDRIVHHKNHRWAYVAVSAPILEGFQIHGKNAEETEQVIANFIAQMAPAVMKNSEKNKN